MLIGLEEKAELFKRLVRENKLGQSYLFFGEPQIGKFSFAGCLANFLENKIFAAPEKLLIDTIFFAQEKNGFLGIETARQLKNFLYQKPILSPRRTVILNNAELLTPEAQNALLKIIEEPPSFSLIIFIAAEASVFFPTLASRLTKIYFPKLNKEKIKNSLIEKRGLKPKQVSEIAEQSFGRIGRAIDLTAQLKNKKREGVNEENIIDCLDELILSLRKDILKNSAKMAWLLERESLLKKYNLNPKLQYKAVQYQLGLNK